MKLAEGRFREAQAYERLLNERQRTVLGLIAEGKTNPEIAEHFGITLDGAKWNVSEILGKLGLSTREEVAQYYRWRRSLPVRARSLRGVLATPAWAMRFGIAGGVVAAAVGAVVLMTALGSTGEPVTNARRAGPNVQVMLWKWDPGPDGKFGTRDDEPGSEKRQDDMSLSEALALAERELGRPIPAPPEQLGQAGQLHSVGITVRNPAPDGLPNLPEVTFSWGAQAADPSAATLTYVALAVGSNNQGEPFDAGSAFVSARWAQSERSVMVELIGEAQSWFFQIAIDGEFPNAEAARDEAVRAANAMQLP